MTAIRPPEYWPRCSYMALVERADRFVLADTLQYSRQSFHNRCRLRTPQGWQWISVPLRGGQHGRPIADTAIEGDPYWMRKHWRSFVHNYGTAPFFPFYEEAIRELLHRPWHRLGDLTSATVELLASLIGVETHLVRASGLDGAPATLPAVREVAGADDVIAFEEVAAHDAAEMPLVGAFRFREQERWQNFAGFEPHCSALDLLFNYGAEARRLLREGGEVVPWAGGIPGVERARPLS